MKTLEITCCRNCPYYDGSDKEMAICSHSNAPKGAYNNIVSRSHYKPEPIPKWCPIIDGKLLIKRDSNDKIISTIKLIITAKIEK